MYWVYRGVDLNRNFGFSWGGSGLIETQVDSYISVPAKMVYYKQILPKIRFSLDFACSKQ